MKDIQPWTLLNSKLAFDHRWYKVRQDEVQLPDGQIISDYFLSVRPDVALVLPITAHQEIVFVRQYRHGAGTVLIELPAGTFDPAHETAETAAIRELREETGYRAEQLIHLGTLYDNPVKETNKIHLFLAEQVELAFEQALDPTEDIDVLLIPLDRVIERVLQGDICVSGTVAAIFLGLKFLAARSQEVTEP